jgi:hypothetical protein
VSDDEQPTAEFDEIRDPDWDDVPEELAQLDGQQVTVVEPDGASRDDVLVIVPQMHAHARRLTEED